MFLWSKQQAAWKSKGVGGLAHWRDFYSQVNDDGTIDDSIEALFGDEYESKTGSAFKKVREGNALSSADITALVDFATLQMVRTPAWFREYSETMANIFPSTTNSVFNKLEAEYAAGMLTEQSIRERAQSAQDTTPFPQFDVGIELDRESGETTITFKTGRRNYLAAVGRILRGDVGTRMHTFDWNVVEMPGDVLLPTSDNPFVRLCVRAGYRPTLQGGIGDEDTWLFMPLTPHHLLFARVGGGRLTKQHLISHT